MNKITAEIGTLESNDIHEMDEINWTVSMDTHTKQLVVSILVENINGYIVLNLDEETWNNLREDVDDMIYDMYFGDKDG